MKITDAQIDLQQAIEDGAQGVTAYVETRMATIFHKPVTESASRYELTRAFSAGANWGYERAVNEMRELLHRSYDEAEATIGERIEEEVPVN